MTKNALYYSAAQVRSLDQRIISQFAISGFELMSRAASSALAQLRRRWPGSRRLLVCCGAGNNAGDGYLLAALARQAGYQLHVIACYPPQQLQGDAQRAWQTYRDSGGQVEAWSGQLPQQVDLIVDALLGTGLNKPLQGAWLACVQAINSLGRPCCALDIPSGLAADNGCALGDAVRADLTVTFIAPKIGLYTGQGPSLSGEVVVDTLGTPAAAYAEQPAVAQGLPADWMRWLPQRDRSAHKGHFGHVLIVGGDVGMAGAVRLAAQAALRCGAGWVSVATQPQHAALVQQAYPSMMCHGVTGAAELAPLLARASVVVLGPGLGRSAWSQALWQEVVLADCPLVVDADGLNCLAQDPRYSDEWILTPHPGEAGRLLGCSNQEIERQRLQQAQQIQQRYGGVCVLKGAGTLVASGEDLPFLCTAGNPGMASAGMGDVLSGVIAAMLAQGLPPGPAAQLGVMLHAQAADRAATQGGERGLLAHDLMTGLWQESNPC